MFYMKKILLSCLSIFVFSNILLSQILNPVKWSFESKKINDTEFDLVATAKLDKGWYIYTQHITGDDGPIPTKFNFKITPQYQLVGKMPNEVSDHKKAGFDKVFQMNVTKFSDIVQFVQRVKISGASASVQGTVEYGTCDDEKCLPPQDANFSYNLSSGAGSSRGSITPPPPSATPQNPTSVPATPQNQNQNAVASNEPNNGKTNTNKNAGQLFEVKPAVIPEVKTEQKAEEKKNGILKPVKWAFHSKKINEKEYDLIFNATIEKGWHIYSQSMNGDGPQPTVFTFEKSNNIEVVGKTSETSPKRSQHKEPLFDNILVIDFAESATFTQRVKIKDALNPVKGTLEYMACDNGQCLPPEEIPFSFNLLTGQGIVQENIPPSVLPILPSDSATTTTTIKIEPSQFTFDKTDENYVCGSETVVSSADDSLWVIFGKGFLAGLLAVLMPCIFPLIPMTVGFFTKGSKDRKTGMRNALIYCASIIVIFVTLGLFLSIAFGSDSLNKFSTHPVVNLIFGLLFIVFALSFFGYFEIALPQSLVNKVDAASDRGGLLGIFFMAFTLVLVSFSCTGPLIGSVLVDTMKYGVSAGAVVCMFGFSLAMALPFGFFAAFPAWLKTLPKSGSWMDDLKVSLGFIEVALAIKFFSNADLIKGWKILPYEAFLGIWILCALGLAAYHSGLLNFKGSHKKINWTMPRIAIVAFSLVSAFYMGLGFRYNPVSKTFRTPELLSGILPPAGYSYIYPQICPLNLECFHDLNEGIAHAKKVNKPILLDFTGWNCANCRKMEEHVWNQQAVLDLIRDKYVLISLYTDDKHELKKPYAAYTSKFDGKLKDTEGEMWTDLEATFFNKNSQPFYVLLSAKDNNLKVLNAPVAYTPDIDKYKDFLQCGLDRFNGVKSAISMKGN
jgi:thiol:disulfide interchange protein